MKKKDNFVSLPPGQPIRELWLHVLIVVHGVKINQSHAPEASRLEPGPADCEHWLHACVNDYYGVKRRVIMSKGQAPMYACYVKNTRPLFEFQRCQCAICLLLHSCINCQNCVHCNSFLSHILDTLNCVISLECI